MEARRIDVLVVDDNPDDAELSLRALLKPPLSLCAQWVSDGATAVELLRTWAGELTLPHVIFLDLNMPGMNGMEVLQSLRREVNLRCLPVVMFSSSSAHDDICSCYDLGANSYVVKASEPVNFTATLRAAASYWAHCNQRC